MTTFLRVAFSVPFLGFVEEEDPLVLGSPPGRSGPEFHFFFSQLFPLLELDGEPPHSVQPCFAPAVVWGWGWPQCL